MVLYIDVDGNKKYRSDFLIQRIKEYARTYNDEDETKWFKAADVFFTGEGEKKTLENVNKIYAWFVAALVSFAITRSLQLQ